jgi:hypothetical protein
MRLMKANSEHTTGARASCRWGMTLLVAGCAVCAGCACPCGGGGAGNPTGHGGLGAHMAGVSGQEPRVPAVQLPENFPKDVPVMPGLAQTGAGESDKERGTGRVTLAGKFKRDEIVTYYSKAMKEGEWSEDENRADGANWLMVYTKERLKTTITVTGDAVGCTVSILYETQQ